MTRPTLATQLRRAREAKGMTREQLEDKCHFPRGHIAGIEGFEWGHPGADHLLAILRALNCCAIINGPDGAFVVSKNQDVKR
ncbi:MAG: helix-turn-helix transcriptional regulator [Bryobacteraceae bacterium]